MRGLLFSSSRLPNSFGYFSMISSHVLMILSEFGAVILVTPKQEVERKSAYICVVKFSNFEVGCENGIVVIVLQYFNPPVTGRRNFL